MAEAHSIPFMVIQGHYPHTLLFNLFNKSGRSEIWDKFLAAKRVKYISRYETSEVYTKITYYFTE